MTDRFDHATEARQQAAVAINDPEITRQEASLRLGYAQVHAILALVQAKEDAEALRSSGELGARKQAAAVATFEEAVRGSQAEALHAAADQMLDPQSGLPFDDDADRAIASAWLHERADRIEKGRS